MADETVVIVSVLVAIVVAVLGIVIAGFWIYLCCGKHRDLVWRRYEAEPEYPSRPLRVTISAGVVSIDNESIDANRYDDEVSLQPSIAPISRRGNIRKGKLFSSQPELGMSKGLGHSLGRMMESEPASHYQLSIDETDELLVDHGMFEMNQIEEYDEEPQIIGSKNNGTSVTESIEVEERNFERPLSVDNPSFDPNVNGGSEEDLLDRDIDEMFPSSPAISQEPHSEESGDRKSVSLSSTDTEQQSKIPPTTTTQPDIKEDENMSTTEERQEDNTVQESTPQLATPPQGDDGSDVNVNQEGVEEVGQDGAADTASTHSKGSSKQQVDSENSSNKHSNTDRESSSSINYGGDTSSESGKTDTSSESNTSPVLKPTPSLLHASAEEDGKETTPTFSISDKEDSTVDQAMKGTDSKEGSMGTNDGDNGDGTQEASAIDNTQSLPTIEMPANDDENNVTTITPLKDNEPLSEENKSTSSLTSGGETSEKKLVSSVSSLANVSHKAPDIGTSVSTHSMSDTESETDLTVGLVQKPAIPKQAVLITATSDNGITGVVDRVSIPEPTVPRKQNREEVDGSVPVETKQPTRRRKVTPAIKDPNLHAQQIMALISSSKTSKTDLGAIQEEGGFREEDEEEYEEDDEGLTRF